MSGADITTAKSPAPLKEPGQVLQSNHAGGRTMERDHFKTPNGKYSSLCGSCLRIVYNMWITNDAPPPGCAEGHDGEIWKCAVVYNTLVSIVIGVDHQNRQPDERQQWLLDQLGSKGVELMADIRAGKEPREYRMKPPRYERAKVQ